MFVLITGLPLPAQTLHDSLSVYSMLSDNYITCYCLK